MTRDVGLFQRDKEFDLEGKTNISEQFTLEFLEYHNAFK